VLINYSPFQTYLAGKAADMLSKQLKTKVAVGHVRIGLLNSVEIQEVYLQDQTGDTLVYAGGIEARITDWFIFKNKPVLHYLGVRNTYVHLHRRHSAVWNYAFIEDAFSSPSQSPKDTTPGKPFELDLDKIQLKDVRVYMDDGWVGEDLRLIIGYMLADANNVDLVEELINLNKIELRESGVTVREYDGLRPPHLKPKHSNAFDSTPFNPDHWKVSADQLLLKSCFFSYDDGDDEPVAGEFDETHMNITGIDIDATGINIVGDTITAKLENMAAAERCGLNIKKMTCNVSVSPIASVCSNLYLETNHSILRDYYAMHYRHFPDFNDYLDSVTMVTQFRDARVDKRDVMFFAPQLSDFPDMVLTMNGRGKGTVTDLNASDLSVTDGFFTLKGNLAMQGLPDINSTLITFRDGEITTTGKGIVHYAPGLKGNPVFSADSVSYLKFNGIFEGYIDNFRVAGNFKSNLGEVITDISLIMPGFHADSATYTGAVTTNHLQLGKVLQLPILGDITTVQKVTGRSFNPDNMQMRLDGVIREFQVNGYRYRNIITEGTLARQQFDGKVLVDDPNLALDFDGHLNYSGNYLNINATAHLLASNLRAMRLVSDSITASADFFLNCTGNNIDNFFGSAKLFNIDLRRNAHRLDIDSVYVLSEGDSTNRSLKVTSGAFNADINGRYKLSELPVSVQYYLSQYIPNYVRRPDAQLSGQQFNFTLNTNEVDSIFAVTMPDIRGFDHARVKGSFNTSVGSMSVDAHVPWAKIGMLELTGAELVGVGDLNRLSLNTTVAFASLADSAIKGAMSLNTTVGNDSVAFTLSTVSPDKESSAMLSGLIRAHEDTLTLTTAPSQFYLSRVKWNVAGGSMVQYSDKYLSVERVFLSSGIQQISVTGSPANGGSVLLNAHNLDVAHLGNIAGLSGYQPDGRVDATASVNDMFGNLRVNANVRASGVKLGVDTVGNVNIVGFYDNKRKLISIDPQTGISRDNAMANISGTLSLDSATGQKLEGTLRFRDARLAWASPFLAGLMSNLRGEINGSVGISGSISKPLIDGALSLSDASLRFDYLGCTYKIPSGAVGISNTRIDFGRMTLYDVFGNTAVLSGYFAHDMFNRMRMRLTFTTPKFEVMNLTHAENELFYGKLIAGMDSFTIRGPFNNVRLNLYGGRPAAKSTIYIPASTGNYTGGYSYVTFKTYGAVQEVKKKVKDKLSINLDADLNSLAEIHIVMDPATNDEIVATGSGNIQMDVPPNNDMRMTGTYTIADGTYTLTFPQLAIHRVFRLSNGSTIAFNGPFAATNLDVDAIYSVKARLFDLLNDADKALLSDNDKRDAQVMQFVNVILHMNGPIYSSRLSFDLDVDGKQSGASVPYQKLQQINKDDRRKSDQVAGLLLVGSFIPEDGPFGSSFGSSALSGTVNNVSQMISNTASTGLTKIVNKLLGNRNVNVAVKYTNYNFNDAASLGGNVNRNQLKLGVTKNYLNDRLLVSLGSTSDWGRPATANAATSINFAGDFRLQYLLSGTNGLRLSAFQTSDFDVVQNKNLQRVGAGIGWRRSFDNLGEFFGGNKYRQKQATLQQAREAAAADTTNKQKKPVKGAKGKK
jgi:hypothetical protein